MITYRYRTYPDDIQALILQQLIHGNSFGRAITEIQQKCKESRWLRLRLAWSLLKFLIHG
jgi:hypothetical protein